MAKDLEPPTTPCDGCGEQFTEDQIDQEVYEERGATLCLECSEEEAQL